MGSVAPPFILCPLSESKELVGITSDRGDNKVIVTLGKNIAIRYHVLEQKQEASWTCSRHWFTSPVMFCPDLEKYGAVIDHSQVALWDESDAHLTARKKYKFADPIHTLKATKGGSTLIIFKNGTVRSLSEAIERKDLPGSKILDESKEVIDDVTLNEKASYVFLTSRMPKEKSTSRCGVEKSDQVKITILKQSTIKPRPGELLIWENAGNAVQIAPVGKEILGGCVVVSGSSSAYVYCCSDGFLYRRFLQNSAENQKVGKVEETETKIAFLGNYISKSSPAVLHSLNASTIVVYGCDPSEEGATVFIYDINYDLLISKQSLKLFGSPAIMFAVENNVFVPVGLHILVLGLRLAKSLLSGMVGQHQIKGVDFFENRDPWTVKGWEGEEAEPELIELKDGEDIEVDEEYPGFEDLVALVKSLEANGQPQATICGQIIPQMLERKSIPGINWITGYFPDIPESHVVSLLTFFISQMEKTTRREIVKAKKQLELPLVNGNHSPIRNGDDPPSTLANYTYPSHPQVDLLLIRPFDQRQMIRSLRSMDFQLAKKFLEYLQNRMESSWDFEIEDEEESRRRTNEISQLLKWTCTILDTHYPQFVFHDETALVDSFQTLVKEKFEIMNDIESLEPLLALTMTKTSYEPGPSPNSKYRCERVVFE